MTKLSDKEHSWSTLWWDSRDFGSFYDLTIYNKTHQQALMNLTISGNEAKEQLAISKNETKFNQRAKLIA